MKVVLDSNVLVSAFTTRGLCADVMRLVLAEHELLTLSPIVREVTRVLTRKLRVPSGTVEEIAGFLNGYVTTAPARPRAHIKLRDPDDAIILEAAIAVGADVLVTGDRDFLDAQAVPGLLIVDPRGFRTLIARKD